MAFDKFKGKKYTTVTASADTEKREVYRKTPAILRKGKEAKINGGFFDYALAVSKSNPLTGGDPNAFRVEQDPVTLETGVYLTASIFREMFLTYLKTTAGFPSSSFTQISASFFSQIGDGMTNMPTGELVAMLNTPFAVGSSGSGTDIIPACTASFSFALHPGVNNDNLVISNTSTNALYSTFVFANIQSTLTRGQRTASNALEAAGLPTRGFDPNGFHYIQEDYEPIFSVGVNTTTGSVDGTDSHIFALTSSYSSSEDFGIISGAALQISGNINSPSAFLQGGRNYAGGSDESSGYFYNQIIKGNVSGEGEFGVGEDNEAVSSFPLQRFIYYPKNTLTVRSGSFLFSSESQGGAHASSSGTATTIYYISGASHTSGAFTGSFCGDATKKVSGSHLWLDADLRTAASSGFYAVPGTGTVLGGFIDGVTGSAIYISTDGSTTRETVPRFSSKSIH